MNKLALKTFFVGFAFWYGLGLLHPNNEMVADWPATVGIICLFVVCFTAAHLIGYRFRRWRSFFGNRNQHRISAWFFAVSVCSCSVLLAVSDTAFAYHAVRVAATGGILSFFAWWHLPSQQRQAFIVFFFLLLLASLLFYSRRPFLTIAATPLVLFLLRQQKGFKFGRVLVALCISWALLCVVTGIRYSDGTGFDVIALFRLGAENLSSAVGFDTIFLTDFVILYYREGAYLFGETFVAGFLNFIPRAFWPDKPYAFGIILSSAFFNVNLDETFTNFGPGIVAEAYANGGPLAVSLAACAFGCGVGILDSYIDRVRDGRSALLACMLLPAVFFFVRGDFVNSFYEFYAKWLVAFFLLKIFGGWSSLRYPPFKY